MALYRLVLVWALRVISALVVSLAVFGAISSALLSSEMQALHGPVEAAAMPSTFDIALQLVPAAGLALLGLALAEILALQLKNTKTP